MNPKNKLAEMPVRPLLYTMAVPLMLSLLIQSLYNIVDSIFVAHLSETALTAASLVYAIQFLMIAIGVGTAVVNMIGGSWWCWCPACGFSSAPWASKKRGLRSGCPR